MAEGKARDIIIHVSFLFFKLKRGAEQLLRYFGMGELRQNGSCTPEAHTLGQNTYTGMGYPVNQNGERRMRDRCGRAVRTANRGAHGPIWSGTQSQN